MIGKSGKNVRRGTVSGVTGRRFIAPPPTRAEMTERLLLMRQRALQRADEGRSHRFEEGVVMALAWALGIDLNTMTRPKSAAPTPQGLDADEAAAWDEAFVEPERVRVKRLDMPIFDGSTGWQNGPMYLVDFPGDRRPGMETEWWSTFLTAAQVDQLETALLAEGVQQARTEREARERCG